MRRQAVTIRHVAAEAGVSLQTVSRVINNEPNVRPVMRERVSAAVARLGYTPSLAARRLAGSRSYLLLALNDRDRTIEAWRLGEGNDWVDQMLFGGMLTCAGHGYRMIFELVDTHSAHVEREVLAALSSLRPDGVILTPPHSDNPAVTRLLAERGVPFARIGSGKEGAGFAIRMDDAAAGRAATEHLLDLDHARVGFVMGDAEYALSTERREGYRRALAARGLPLDPALECAGDWSLAAGERAGAALLAMANPATAIVASNDQMALGVLRAAQARGVAVPAALSLVSFDDTPVVKFATPPLTAIAQPIAAMTATAAELLIQAAAGGAPDDERRVVPFALAVRGSTARRG